MSAILHDFRSDTVTRPSEGMRKAIAEAEVGDDLYQDDPTVLRLQSVLAERVGKEAGLFVPSGTMSNLVALMTHCGRGDEYIAGQSAHCYVNEAGGAAVLGSIQPQPLANQPDGTLKLEDIEAAIKPDDIHFARTKLLALENTIGGKVIGLDYMQKATDFAHAKGLATHLDGARLFNAAVALGVPAAEVARGFDSVSICLSKGLGAPVGSVLLGSRDFIAAAHRNRKILGGGLRQSGVLAAAGLYALEHNVERLAEDHALAIDLQKGLAQFDGLDVKPAATNMVFLEVTGADGEAFESFLAERGVAMHSRYGRQRWVCHLDVGPGDVEAALKVVGAFFG